MACQHYQLQPHSDQPEREGLRDGVAGIGGAELAPPVREGERDSALGNLQRLADFRSRLTVCRLGQTLALAIAEKPVSSAVEPAQQPHPVHPPSGTAPPPLMKGP